MRVESVVSSCRSDVIEDEEDVRVASEVSNLRIQQM